MLEKLGRTLALGFGDRVLVGILLGLLDNVSPMRLYEYLRDDLKLGYWISEKDWRKYKRLAKQANIGNITREDVINELREYRPDLLGVLLNHPQGLTWLDSQIAEMKRKLELE